MLTSNSIEINCDLRLTSHVELYICDEVPCSLPVRQLDEVLEMYHSPVCSLCEKLQRMRKQVGWTAETTGTFP